jgi:hypothetical protein
MWSLGAAVVATACASTAQSDAGATPQQTAPTAAAQQASAAASPAFKEFLSRVDTYVELHERFEKSLPPLPKETSPIVIDKHQRALATLIQKERTQARRGDIITPAAEREMRAVLKQVFGGPDGKQLRASILDENPGELKGKLTVNSRYPDEIPLSTVPPQVLAALPKLPADVEYRFLGDRLIILDVHAHIVIDFIDNALPV